MGVKGRDPIWQNPKLWPDRCIVANQDEYEQIIAPIEQGMITSIWGIVRNADDAEEAMQDALLTIWKRWHRVRTHVNPQALVRRICIDSAYDVLRRKYRSRRFQTTKELTTSSTRAAPNPPDVAASKERQTEIAMAISRLPRQQATATFMRIVEEQSYEDIAAALGCSQATARRHVAKGRERLRNWLSHLVPHNIRSGPYEH